MKECCEKWKELTWIAKSLKNYCPTCGTKLEGEWCECETPNVSTAGMLPPSKKCNICNRRIKPKKELPEKLDSDVCYNRSFILQKINEIIDWLKENLCQK